MSAPDPDARDVTHERQVALGNRPSAWERARAGVRGEDPLTGWLATLGVTLLAFLLRLWHLGRPHEFEFDETYYAKDAWSLAHFGYVKDYVADANDKILDGTVSGVWQDTPSMIVHPEVGKWLIALGEKAFGMDPFGWRIASAVAGALMIWVMVRLVRRMTRSTLLGVVAGVLLSLDGLQFVLSRLALLDIFVALFCLCGVACVVADRDWFRGRLARLVPTQAEGAEARGWRPVVLWRPWLLAAGVMFGLALGTKWTAAYLLAVFGVLVWVWSAGARRSLGFRGTLVRSALIDGPVAFAHVVLVALVVYVVSWTGWLLHADQYEEHLSATQYTSYAGRGHCEEQSYIVDHPRQDARWPSAEEPDAHGIGEVVQSLRSLWSYHHDVYTFHAHFLNCATHTYASDPLGWLVLNRPVGVAADVDIQPGTQGCTAPEGSDCLRQVILLGTPVLWWGGCLALLACAVLWVGRRDWRCGVAVVGALASWLPWLLYDDRPIFSYYAIVTLPFLVLAVTLVIGRLIGMAGRRRTAGVVVAGAFVVLVLANFAWFWPIYTDQLLTHGQWLDRIWFGRWI